MFCAFHQRRSRARPRTIRNQVLTLILPAKKPVIANKAYRTALAVSLSWVSCVPLHAPISGSQSDAEAADSPGTEPANGTEHADGAEAHKADDADLDPWRVVCGSEPGPVKRRGDLVLGPKWI
jgi:hypothetical protein